MTGKLRVGIIGLGRIFDLHCLGYRENPLVEVVGLCDARAVLLQQRASEFPAAHRVESFEQLLRLDCDLVEILTPHPLHAEMVCAGLRAGSHVSVQKPMAMTLAEADRMIQASREGGRHLRVFENFVFYPPLQKAKQLLEAGTIGRPLHFRMKMVSGNRNFAWHVPTEANLWRDALGLQGLGGPLVFDHGHHMMAVALWLFGNVRDVFARIETTTLPTGRVVDAPASVLWRHADPPVHGIWDVSAAPQMRVRTDYYASHEQFEIQGEAGIIQVNRASGRLLDEPAVTVYCDGEVHAFHNLENDWGASFRRSTEHFVRFLIGQEERIILTPEEGRRVLEFAHLVLESSRKEQPTRPPLQAGS
jgi:predicted dehydrogenase